MASCFQCVYFVLVSEQRLLSRLLQPSLKRAMLVGAGGWPLPTTHTWEDAPGHHGSQKRTALGLGDGKLKRITTGRPHGLPCISGLGCRKGMGEFVPDPESSSSLPTPRSVVVGLLLAISQSAALGQVGSAVSLPGRILSPWKSHRVRMKPTPPRPSASVPTPDPVAPTRASEGAFPCSGTSTSKIPFPGVRGAIEEEKSQVWAGLLGIKVRGGPRARHPVAFRESHSRVQRSLHVPRPPVSVLSCCWSRPGELAASARTPGTLVLEINCSHDSYS